MANVLTFIIILGIPMLLVYALVRRHRQSKGQGHTNAISKTGIIFTIRHHDLIKIVRDGVFTKDVAELKSDIQAYALKNQKDDKTVREGIIAAFPAVIKDALADGVFSAEEEQKIESLCTAYGIEPERDMSQDDRTLLIRAAIVRNLLNGDAKPQINVPDMPFKLIKNEVIIWVYRKIGIAELRSKSRMVGGSRGVSIKIAKGIYYRLGKMEGERITSKELKDLGPGAVIITSHHLFYQAGANSKRIKHDKIYNIAPYTDGVIIYQDGASANPLILKTDDIWFLTNVLQNAHNWVL